MKLDRSVPNMEDQMGRENHGCAPNTFGQPIAMDAPASWAESPVLYLLNCYDVWSATPPRGCEPANSNATDSQEDSGIAA